jgi:hypothetical protein
MRTNPRALAAASLIAAGTLSAAAQQPAPFETARGAARATVSRTTVSRIRSDGFTTIQGNALTSTDGPLNGVTVRLRDARFGRIVGTQLTDKSGLFAFKAVDPGTYIVEIINNDESVLAASQLLNVNAGEAISAVVKLPFRVPPVAGLMGGADAPAVIAVQAAATAIAAVVPTAPISPIQ